jgi:hypothetical protein
MRYDDETDESRNRDMESANEKPWVWWWRYWVAFFRQKPVQPTAEVKAVRFPQAHRSSD